MAQVTSTALKQDDITATASPRGQKADGAFRTISEVAEELNVPQHVLRFWETRFFQIRPLKRGGGRRYYRPEDVALLKRIHHLLYAEGYTIKGVQKLLKTTPKAAFLAGTNGAPDMASFMPSTPPANEHAAPVSAPAASDLTTAQRATLQSALDDLQAIRDELSGV